MAKDKKGFILYADQKELFDQLPNEKAGELIKFIFSYVNDENPITKDLILNMAFTPIKQQFKRDLVKWEKTRKARSDAGKASAESKRLKKEQTPTNPTNVDFVQQTPTNPTVNDNVTVTVNDNVKEKELLFVSFWDLYNKKTGKDKTKTKFMKLPIDIMAKIIKAVPNYVKLTPDKKFRKDPATYLNGKHWEDELEIKPVRTQQSRIPL